MENLTVYYLIAKLQSSFLFVYKEKFTDEIALMLLDFVENYSFILAYIV